MKSTLALALSIATLASAQVQDLPKCAVQCFAKALASTTCAATDAHCACTTGAADFIKVAIPCLCEAGCSVEELKRIETSTNNLCAAALSAKGEDYTPATLDPKICQAVETGTTSSASCASVSLTSVTGTATATQTASVTETATATATDTASTTATATAAETAAPESTGGASGNGFMVHGVLVGLGVVGLVLM